MRCNFYPRPPRGGRPQLCRVYADRYRFLSTPSARRATDPIRARRSGCTISIHALREEGDLGRTVPDLQPGLFLSTPSARRATDLLDRWNVSVEISIHALREEGDDVSIDEAGIDYSNFYPRPPRGGRRPVQTVPITAPIFLSTPSARRATTAFQISLSARAYFYPRPPRGGRRLNGF